MFSIHLTSNFSDSGSRSPAPAQIAVLCRDHSYSHKIRRVFSGNGFAVKTFHSLLRMLSWLNRHPADVVLVSAHKQTQAPRHVRQIRSRYPLLPILLVADGCSPEVVRSAIQSGANHFVGEITQAEQVAGTVERLLQFRLEHVRYTKVLPYMRSTVELELPSDLELLGGVVYYLTEELFKHGLIGIEQINVKIALVEALTNAMEHGNRFDKKKKVHVRASFDPERAVFDIRDEGEGFDFRSLPDPTQKEFLFRPRGRGVYMMRQFMDEVTFHEPGNRVVLVKKRAVEQVVPRPFPWERRGI